MRCRRAASAENLFDFLFGGAQKQQHQAPPQANFFADPFSQQPAPAPSAPGRLSRFRTRILRAQLRRPVFPAVARQRNAGSDVPGVLSGQSRPRFSTAASIDSASSATGERYADSENAYAYRKALRADCTCNGRDAAGLAPVDLTLDTSLRAGDVIATTNGLVAYSGVKVGVNQTAEFTPVASYPGLTSEVRARLGEMKVAPVAAEMVAEEPPMAETSRDVVAPMSSVPKSSSAKGKRAEAN